MNLIFLSYRREDSADVSGRINDRLAQHFGQEAIFTDVDSIPLGIDFQQYIDEQVSKCGIFLAVIGRDWLSVTDTDGRPRLQQSGDFVRIEVESALQRNIPVIPLLVRRATMPSGDDLPDTLNELATRNGMMIRPNPDFHRDMERLINGIEQHLSRQSEAAAKREAEEQTAKEREEHQSREAAAKREAEEQTAKEREEHQSREAAAKRKAEEQTAKEREEHQSREAAAKRKAEEQTAKECEERQKLEAEAKRETEEDKKKSAIEPEQTKDNGASFWGMVFTGCLLGSVIGGILGTIFNDWEVVKSIFLFGVGGIGFGVVGWVVERSEKNRKI